MLDAVILDAHLPLLYTLVATVLLGLFMLGLSAYLGPRRMSPIKQEVFECGNPVSGDSRERINVKFYLVAILFLVFDIEAVFIYPWAVNLLDAVKGANDLSPVVAIVSMLAFVGVIVVALVYAWRKGALEWGPKSEVTLPEPTLGQH